MNKILITGGAGFIGQHLTRALLKKNFFIRIIDNFNPQTHLIDKLPDDLAGDVDLIKGDIRNTEVLEEALKDINVVVHLAADTGTGQSMYEIDRYFSTNVQGTATLLDLIQNSNRDSSLQSIVVASSRAIYGEGAYQCDKHDIVFPNQRNHSHMAEGCFEPICPLCQSALALMPTPEYAPFMPMSIYGLTKQIQEQAILMVARSRGINGFALRYQNVYGPGQSLKNPYTGILAVFSNLARQNQDIEIYEDGLESRDFVFIDDIVEATIRSINFPGQYVGSLNVGTGIATNVLTVAKEIKAFFNSESRIKVSGNFRMGDIRHNIADISSLQKVLGFTPKITFEAGVVKFLKWTTTQNLEDQSAYLHSVNELASRGLMGRASINRKNNQNG
jgi:dTDP-L-rhamnose 4-epimerase